MPITARMPQVAYILGVRRVWQQDREEPMRLQQAKVEENNSSYKKGDEKGIPIDELKLLYSYQRLSARQQDFI